MTPLRLLLRDYRSRAGWGLRLVLLAPAAALLLGLTVPWPSTIALMALTYGTIVLVVLRPLPPGPRPTGRLTRVAPALLILTVAAYFALLLFFTEVTPGGVRFAKGFVLTEMGTALLGEFGSIPAVLESLSYDAFKVWTAASVSLVHFGILVTWLGSLGLATALLLGACAEPPPLAGTPAAPRAGPVRRATDPRARVPTATPSVFVSHSSRDRSLVEQEIVTPLRAHGVRAWYATEEIRTAADWQRSIQSGLEACDELLVVVSANALASDWVRAEVLWAMEHRRGRVLVVRIDDSDPARLHLQLPLLQHVDFRGERRAARARLLGHWPRPDPST